MPKITKNFVDTIQPPSKGQDFYRDDDLQGFGLRVTRGSKTYIVEARVYGSRRNRRVTLGKHGKLTPELARRQAKQLIAEMAVGVDPLINRANNKVRQVTLGEVRDRYISIRPMSKHGLKNYTGLLNRCLGDWLNKPMNSITKDMIEIRHRELTRPTRFGTSGECQANQAMLALNTLFRFAQEYYEDVDGQPVIIRNPVRRLSHNRQWHVIPRRQNIVMDEDLPAWYAALSVVRPKIQDYLLLIALTGMRRMEAAQLKFEYVDWMRRTISIPASNTKNKHTYKLPITPFVFDLLLRRKAQSLGSEYIFPGIGGRGHIIDPYLDRLFAATRFQWTPHDLRRTFITAAEKIGLTHGTIKRLVNHVGGRDVTSGYIVADVEQLREPLERVNRHLLDASRKKPNLSISRRPVLRPLIGRYRSLWKRKITQKQPRPDSHKPSPVLQSERL